MIKNFTRLLLDSPHRRYLLVFIILFLTYNIPAMISSMSTPFVRNFIVNLAERNGLDIQIGELDYSFPDRMKAQSILLRQPSVPAFHLDYINLHYTKALSSPIMLVHLGMYEGKLFCNMEFQNRIPDLPLNTRCNMDNLLVQGYPLAFALGVEGVLSGILEGSFDRDLSKTQATFSIMISEGSFDPGKNQFTRILNLGILSTIDVQLDGSLNGDSIQIHNATLKSSLGSITSAHGNISRLSQSNPWVSLSGTIKLNPDGMNKLGSWLALLDNSRELASETNEIRIEGDLRAPSVRIRSAN